MRIEKLKITRALCVSVAAAAVAVNDGKAANGQQASGLRGNVVVFVIG